MALFVASGRVWLLLNHVLERDKWILSKHLHICVCLNVSRNLDNSVARWNMLLGIVTRKYTRYLLSFSSSLHSRFPSTTPEPFSLSFLIKWAKSEVEVREWSRVEEIPEEEEVTSRLLSCVLTRLMYWRPSSVVLAEQKLNYSLDWKIKSFFVLSFRHCFPSLWSSVGRQACFYPSANTAAESVMMTWHEGWTE